MKNIFIIAVSVVGLYACNDSSNTEQKVASAIDTIKQQVADTVASVYDPDPADSIPAGQYGINSSSKQTAELVTAIVKNKFKKDIEQQLLDSFSRKFIFFEYDLNDDGKKEIFVGFVGMYFCGTGGCTQLLLDNDGNEINTFTVADYPIVIDNHKTNGWKDLFIRSGNKDHIVKFDGKKYPSNPSLLPVLKVLPGDGLPRALNYLNEPYAWFKF